MLGQGGIMFICDIVKTALDYTNLVCALFAWYCKKQWKVTKEKAT